MALFCATHGPAGALTGHSVEGGAVSPAGPWWGAMGKVGKMGKVAFRGGDKGLATDWRGGFLDAD